MSRRLPRLRPGEFVVNVSREGSLFLNGLPVSLDQLRRVLETERGRASRVIYLREQAGLDPPDAVKSVLPELLPLIGDRIVFGHDAPSHWGQIQAFLLYIPDEFRIFLTRGNPVTLMVRTDPSIQAPIFLGEGPWDSFLEELDLLVRNDRVLETESQSPPDARSPRLKIEIRYEGQEPYQAAWSTHALPGNISTFVDECRKLALQAIEAGPQRLLTGKGLADRLLGMSGGSARPAVPEGEGATGPKSEVGSEREPGSESKKSWFSRILGSVLELTPAQRLYNAVAARDLVQVQTELASGADPETLGPSGASMLGGAVLQNEVAIVHALLESGAQPNTSLGGKDEHLRGMPVLVAAAQMGHREIVGMLLEHGAAVDARDEAGTTPLIAAANQNRDDIVRLLLEWKANPEATTAGGTRALISAAYGGASKAVTVLLEHKVDANAADLEGCTALMSAAQFGHTEIVRYLLANGADPTAKSVKGYTARFLAEHNGHASAASLLGG